MGSIIETNGVGPRHAAARDYLTMLVNVRLWLRLLTFAQPLLPVLLAGGCLAPALPADDQTDGAGAGGSDESGRCREQFGPIDDASEAKLGFSVSTLVGTVSGEHESKLAWIYGHITLLTLTMSDARAYYVVSRARSGASSTGSLCTNHLAIDGRLSLRTEDGQLADELPVRLSAYSGDEAFGVVTIDADALGGTYAPYRPAVEGRKCFKQVELRLLIAVDGIHGSIADVIAEGACDQPANVPPSRVATGRWGTRWLNY